MAPTNHAAANPNRPQTPTLEALHGDPNLVVSTRVVAYLDKVRRLPPDKLRQVEALVTHLESEERERKSRFRNVSGTLADDDARAMKRAVEDCERIDPRGW